MGSVHLTPALGPSSHGGFNAHMYVGVGKELGVLRLRGWCTCVYTHTHAQFAHSPPLGKGRTSETSDGRQG